MDKYFEETAKLAKELKISFYQAAYIRFCKAYNIEIDEKILNKY